MVFSRRFIIFILVLIFVSLFAMLKKGQIETNLLRTLLPQSIINSTEIITIADKTASTIRVVFEENKGVNGEAKESDKSLKEQFISRIDNDYFEVENYNIDELFQNYMKAPANFLSSAHRALLQQKKYDEIFENRFVALLDPAGIQLSQLDKDPYLFLDDFLLSNRYNTFDIDDLSDKQYGYLNLKLKLNQGLSPDLSNKKIQGLIKIQKELSDNEHKVYLAGNPIHSYYASKKSIAAINLISILSILMIVFLTYFYFRKYKLLIPIVLAIFSGMLLGFAVTKIWFNSFQIITMVFSTTLIGIGIDYSYHYYFSADSKNIFRKKLTLSLITTIVPFVLLYMTGIELLKQISVFTVVGLVTIFSIVIFMYPEAVDIKPVKTIRLQKSWVKNILICLCILSFFSFLRFKINYSLNSLYLPTKKLMQAETLYNKVAGSFYGETQFIVVNGKNEQELLENEEKITSKLTEQGIKYTALSAFAPSYKKQKENFELVQDLYKNNLHKYSSILNSEQIFKLKNQRFVPVYFNINNFPLKSFLIDKNKSTILVFADKKLDFENVVNIQANTSEYMKKYAKKLIKIFPPVIIIITLILVLNYGIKDGIKIILPSLCGIIGALGLVLLILGEINLFSLIALFMVLGFTMDYSIFRISKGTQTEDSILVSAATTTFSFLLLSLCGFKLLSSLSLILFFGILISYLTGYMLFENKD